ncbi:hypothetical protein [Tellurirhabdus bombi]|uniref:hypothetical protein n=1 Tax=Tellurirhabdus bombi TaxID=2907205 RepID=UPI001F248F16|nr:hypothetical protein [Tellurirhabdus bombi]
MANNKTTNQPGSDNKQPNSDRNRNVDARDTSGQKPNMEQERSNRDKTVQGDNEPDSAEGKTKTELEHERGGHGRSGHSSSRSGSDSGGGK